MNICLDMSAAGTLQLAHDMIATAIEVDNLVKPLMIWLVSCTLQLCILIFLANLHNPTLFVELKSGMLT